MAVVYAVLIRKGLKALKDVPEVIRNEVKKILAEDGG